MTNSKKINSKSPNYGAVWAVVPTEAPQVEMATAVMAAVGNAANLTGVPK